MRSLEQLRRLVRRLVRDERGAQFVELAVVAPVLIMLFATSAELGRLFYTYSTLAKATNVGARYLSKADLSTSAKLDAEKVKAQNLVVCGNAAGCGGNTGFSPVAKCANSEGGSYGDMQSSNVAFPTLTVTGTDKKVGVAVSGCYYKPLVDLGEILHAPSLSLRIELSPTTTVRYMR